MTVRRCRSPKISIRSVTSVRAVSTNRSAAALSFGERDLHGLDAGAGQDRVEGCSELPGPVADQKPEVRGAVTEIHREIADLLRGPQPVRVGGDPEDVHVAGADLHRIRRKQVLGGLTHEYQAAA